MDEFIDNDYSNNNDNNENPTPQQPPVDNGLDFDIDAFLARTHAWAGPSSWTVEDVDKSYDLADYGVVYKMRAAPKLLLQYHDLA